MHGLYRIDRSNPIIKVKYTKMKKITILLHTQAKHDTRIPLKNFFIITKQKKLVQAGGWSGDYLIPKTNECF